MAKTSTDERATELSLPLSSRMNRRDFLAGAAACAAMSSSLVHAATHALDRKAMLHVASSASHSGYVHTYALTSSNCKLLGATAVDAFAALAPHPLLPVLYVARDCLQWEGLPRGVIETYAVERDMRPLRLLTRTLMSLSATGPRSLAVSSCGRHLLVSASTGGAWNAFALDREGVPACVAVARKETGVVLNSHRMSLPTPHGLAFSPHAPFAVGTDPGSGRLSVLQPSPEGIAVYARYQPTYGLIPASPAWMNDGKHILVANARNASFSIYAMKFASEDGNNASVHLPRLQLPRLQLVGTTPTVTPVTTLMAHPTRPAVFTSRPENSGSRLELWNIHGSDLQLAMDTWVPGHVVALAQHDGGLWIAMQNRLIRIPIENLRCPHPFEVSLPVHGVQAIATQNLAAL